MPNNYEVYIVNTEIENEDCALSAISKVLQWGDKRGCFALTDPSSSEQISKWENDPNVTVLEVVDIYPPSDIPRMRAFIEKIGQPIRRHVCLLRFEGPYTIEGLKYFWFDMGFFFGHVIYIGKDNSFPQHAWREYVKITMEQLHEDTGYVEIIFNDWGILSFSQLNSEPGDRYITEIVEFSKSSGLGRDFITWGQARTIEEVDAEKDL